MRPSRRLAHMHFAIDEVASLRSLLSLLAPYLKSDWQVVEDGDADVVLMRLDAPRPTTESGNSRRVACVRRPRDAQGPAIHRPLRAAEILALLNEMEASENAARAALEIERAVVLAYWPTEFEEWPPAWTRVLASIVRTPRSAAQICAATGVNKIEVGNCLAELQRIDALTFAAGQVATAEPATGLRNLIRRVGRKLGFKGE